MFIIWNPLVKKFTAVKVFSASVKLANNSLFLGFVGVLLLSIIAQLPALSVLLSINQAGSNPVFTTGPFVEPLPVYEPIDEYPATDLKAYKDNGKTKYIVI